MEKGGDHVKSLNAQPEVTLDKLTFDPQVGVLLTGEMDAEIDRILPSFREVYPGVRLKKLRTRVDVFHFINPYTGLCCRTPLEVDYDEDKRAGWGWTRLYMVAVNAALHEDLKDWQYRRVLAHELIHVIDPTFCFWDRYYRPEDGRDKYLGQDCEFNAFSGMVAYSIRKNAKTWRGTEHHHRWEVALRETYEVVDDPKTLVEVWKKPGIFDSYYLGMLLEYQKILAPDRYRLFAGRIRLAIDAALRHLEGHTQTPFLNVSPGPCGAVGA